jgi:exodeoxyribonuclease-5
MNELDFATNNRLNVNWNPDQLSAVRQILDAIRERENVLVTGHAGSGKTTLVQGIAAYLQDTKHEIILTAPTHKAVSVLEKKLEAAGIFVPCTTTHQLLSLRPKIVGDRQIFERSKHAKPIKADVIGLDETSMVAADLMGHIHRYLSKRTVMFVGDPAQLPPVGEKESLSFTTRRKVHLGIIERQKADNPILDAADAIRASQGGVADWSWCKPAMNKPYGVYVPGPDRIGSWMQKAFTSDEFKADTDKHRYLCWTNAKVAAVNSRVRQWIYGDDLPTPFMPGERALLRAPLIEGDDIVMNTNEEPTVVSIRPHEKLIQVFDRKADLEPIWTAILPTWLMELRSDKGLEVEAQMPRDRGIYDDIINKLVDERRWWSYHSIKGALVNAQSIYAMTIHNSQGSTLGNVFLDVGEMKRWSKSNLLEAQKGTYVGSTRATDALILVGVDR